MDLTDLDVTSPLSYLAAFALPALDVILPLLPSETAVIALGVATAGRWDARVPLLVAVAAVGAFTGDNLGYLIGQRGAGWARRRLLSGPRGAGRLDWAVRTLDRYGAGLVVVCRFIPGGRTAVTLACGLTGYPRRRFVPVTAAAAVLWATYAFLLGRIGGAAFADRPWVGLVLALGLAVAATGLIEIGRRLVGRARRRPGSGAGSAAGAPGPSASGDPAASGPVAPEVVAADRIVGITGPMPTAVGAPDRADRIGP